MVVVLVKLVLAAGLAVVWSCGSASLSNREKAWLQFGEALWLVARFVEVVLVGKFDGAASLAVGCGDALSSDSVGLLVASWGRTAWVLLTKFALHDAALCAAQIFCTVLGVQTGNFNIFCPV
jgi:hypothetical protein